MKVFWIILTIVLTALTVYAAYMSRGYWAFGAEWFFWGSIIGATYLTAREAKNEEKENL